MILVSEIIAKTRDGMALSENEISFLIGGISDGSIPDYQSAAWLMAAYLKGLTPAETKILTQKMKESGKSLDWKKLHPAFKDFTFVDKHSTGGVGDKVSLILAPLVACMGIKVPMMSGRGLGHTGGTVDKLQSIAGFSMYPTQVKMIEALNQVGVCMMAQANDLCPADKKLYSLRDVTATVSSIPLITASILSKKWAEGAEKIVFDVKSGPAAFMQSFDQAKALAQSLVRTAKDAGIEATAFVTRMDEPLGRMVGNSLEVMESLEILKQKFPSENEKILAHDLTELTLDQAAEMARLGGLSGDFESLKAKARTILESGAAYKKFCEMAAFQGAEKQWEEKLPRAPFQLKLLAPKKAFISKILSREMGLLAIDMGAGRKKVEDSVDPAVGIELCQRVGNEVLEGTPLLVCHVHKKDWFEKNQQLLLNLFEFTSEKVSHPPELLMEKIC